MSHDDHIGLMKKMRGKRDRRFRERRLATDRERRGDTLLSDRQAPLGDRKGKKDVFRSATIRIRTKTQKGEITSFRECNFRLCVFL